MHVYSSSKLHIDTQILDGFGDGIEENLFGYVKKNCLKPANQALQVLGVYLCYYFTSSINARDVAYVAKSNAAG